MKAWIFTLQGQLLAPDAREQDFDPCRPNNKHRLFDVCFSNRAANLSYVYP
jgi:hypothetical protein